jgi:probable rRNA maturation factor
MKSQRELRAPRLDLTVQYAVAVRNRPSRAQLRKWVRAALEHDARMTVRIVGRDEAALLNCRFCSGDHATNVLTFVYRDTPPYDGDLVLCAPVVTQEAKEQGKSAAAHYAHLVVHGTLHLQGYDHDRSAHAGVMEARESQIVRKLGYPEPYSRLDKTPDKRTARRAA